MSVEVRRKKRKKVRVVDLSISKLKSTSLADPSNLPLKTVSGVRCAARSSRRGSLTLLPSASVRPAAPEPLR